MWHSQNRYTLQYVYMRNYSLKPIFARACFLYIVQSTKLQSQYFHYYFYYWKGIRIYITTCWPKSFHFCIKLAKLNKLWQIKYLARVIKLYSTSQNVRIIRYFGPHCRITQRFLKQETLSLTNNNIITRPTNTIKIKITVLWRLC